MTLKVLADMMVQIEFPSCLGLKCPVHFSWRCVLGGFNQVDSHFAMLIVALL